MGNTKWIHLFFVVGGLLAWFVLKQSVDWIWGYFDTPNELYAVGISGVVAVVGTVIAWRKESLFQNASDIVNELSKVTWPTRKETSAATVVVIITTIISSLFLGVFDLVWSWASAEIYKLG